LLLDGELRAIDLQEELRIGAPEGVWETVGEKGVSGETFMYAWVQSPIDKECFALVAARYCSSPI